MQAYVSNGSFPVIRTQLLEDWSIYNYIPERGETPADHFFKTFGKFSAAKVGSEGAALTRPGRGTAALLS
jgi:hypothetical protein